MGRTRTTLTRVVLGGRYPIVLHGLSSLISLAAGFEVTAVVIGVEALLEAVQQHQPDLVVISTSIAEDFFAVFSRVAAAAPQTPLVALSRPLNGPELLRLLQCGVRGVLPLDIPTRLVAECCRRVAAGGQWLERSAASNIIDGVLRAIEGEHSIRDKLTVRQFEIVRLAATGLRRADIAAKLNLSPATVKVHLYAIYRKLNVVSQVELMQLAKESGLDHA
jgi:DNA-binding NarL/FixJ family response regulator